ncbi:MAG: single-stranded DNA-binding protein [Candidatus Eisenbacteria bacterium]|uniref:Single-stranded DNA-binding protein n=1 Tax=Eiseniibacteriota bacterium TaxID=2212470 RepID=A0A956NFX0_UNCEI|nr:single-stranded DNA-binding protein [Candidatus Eisenbacteria bacterium]
MRSINKVILIGNLGTDPEIRHTSGGQAVCNFRIATNESWGGRDGQERQERTEWHNIVAWGRLAEICNEYLRKGKQVYLEGRLQTRQWEDKDGVKRYTTEIVAQNMMMLGGPGGGGGGGDYGGGGGGNYASRQPSRESQRVAAPADVPDSGPGGGGGDFFDDDNDLPF